MSDYTVAKLDEIDEITDGRCPWRPVRHHFGITSFGVNAFTGQQRRRPDHQRARRGGRARPAGGALPRPPGAARGSSSTASASTRRPARSSSSAPDVKRTAFAEEPGTTLVAIGGTPGKAYEPHGWEVWMPLHQLYQAGEYERGAERAAS